MSPDGGAKAYGLLRKALMETGKAGLAKIIIRSKEQLAVIRVYEKTLLMETIHYPDEVRNVAEVPNVPNEDGVSKKEIDTAVLLIDQLTTPFEPEKYEDEYRNRVMELIQSKQKGEKTVTAKTEKPTENITDLMAALQASIDKSKPEKKTTKRKKTTKKIAESK